MQQEVVLYQFSLCPFCSKVRAGLDIKGIPYRLVEVNPRTKAELPPLPEGTPRKVPVLVTGDRTVTDSTEILRFLDEAYPDTRRFVPAEEGPLRSRALEREEWIDEELIRALPTVLYGTLREAGRAAGVVARGANYGALQGLGVMVGGSLIMHLVARRLLKKAGRRDGHAWVGENLDQVERWLTEDGGPYLCGEELTLVDVALYGALRCVEAFPFYTTLEARPRLRPWLDRMAAQAANAVTTQTAHASSALGASESAAS